MSFSLFKGLVLLAFLFNPFSAHECVHGQRNIPIKSLKLEEHHSKRFTNFASTKNYQNIRIAFDFTNLDSALGSYNYQYHIKEDLIPAAKNYFEAALKVIPLTSRIKVPAKLCEGITIPAHATDVGYEGDIVVFVTGRNERRSSFLASAWVCANDPVTQRPTVAVIDYNFKYMSYGLKSIEVENELSTTLHELTHCFGFSHFLFPQYINPDTLEPLKDHFFNKTVNGVNTLVLNLPPLTERLRAYFNCPTLEGAYMENQGGLANAGSHFERRIFYNEHMTASDIPDPRISEFTLALLEGTGWYQVDYQYAEPMTYGKNAGCDFLDTPCMDRKTVKPNFKEFCSPLTSKGVSWTKRTFGDCGNYKYETWLSSIDEFDYWGNKTIVTDTYADNCPHIRIDSYLDCEDATRASEARLGDYEFYGIGGKAFMGTLSRKASPFTSLKGFCFKPQCQKMNDGKYELQVFFGGKKDPVVCSAAGSIDASDFPFWFNDMKGVLECPDPNEFCEQIESEGHCRGGCFGRGVCSDKKCKCNDGWSSYNCAKKIFSDHCSRCTSDPLRTSCFGDDKCVCSSSNNTCQCLLGARTGIVCSFANNGYIYVTLAVVAFLVGIVTLARYLAKKRKEKNKATQESFCDPSEHYQAHAHDISL